MILETQILEPQPGPQADFFATDADICIYGGSAGGGKTWALLVEPIQCLLEEPGFGGVIFRRTFPQIMAEGGLWDEACSIYPDFDGRPRTGNCDFVFRPFGNTISFHHLQHEQSKLDWQGSQICYLAFDELTHFSESQFWYLLSRNRSTCGVRPYVRATCNPEPGWVKDLLAPWVDDAFPGNRAESGELRWFVRIDGKIQWVSQDHPDAKSLTFIRASIYDNQVLLERNPEYLATLKALPSVERARLLDGDWNVRREGLVYPGFDACIVESAPDHDPTSGGIDFGFHNPFAAPWGFLDHDDVLWVTGCRYVRQTTMPVHAEGIPKGVQWWCDPAQPESIAQLRAHGHQCLPCIHRPVRGASGEMRKPVLAGVDMVSERIRTGRLKIVRQACLPLIRELSRYHYDPMKQAEEPVKEDDHACDGLRYWVVGLDRHREVPGMIESDEAREAREKAEEQARQQEAEERDRAAQADPDNERWWI